MIGIFDSGSGGLSVLREILKVLPREKYLFFADNAFCPYGEKTPQFIQDRGRAITDYLLSEGADIIVVACNTATAVAAETLRGRYAVPIVGIEPAVKSALAVHEQKRVLVVATPVTLREEKLHRLLDRL